MKDLAKRQLSFLLALCMLWLPLPVEAYAGTASEGGESAGGETPTAETYALSTNAELLNAVMAADSDYTPTSLKKSSVTAAATRGFVVEGSSIRTTGLEARWRDFASYMQVTFDCPDDAYYDISFDMTAKESKSIVLVGGYFLDLSMDNLVNPLYDYGALARNVVEDGWDLIRKEGISVDPNNFFQGSTDGTQKHCELTKRGGTLTLMFSLGGYGYDSNPVDNTDEFQKGVLSNLKFTRRTNQLDVSAENGTVNVTAGDGSDLNASGVPSYSKIVGRGTEVTLEAQPNSGYHFTKWVDAQGNEISKNRVITQTIGKDAGDASVYTYKAVCEAGSDPMLDILLENSSANTLSGANTIISAVGEWRVFNNQIYTSFSSSSGISEDCALSLNLDKITVISGEAYLSQSEYNQGSMRILLDGEPIGEAFKAQWIPESNGRTPFTFSVEVPAGQHTLTFVPEKWNCSYYLDNLMGIAPENASVTIHAADFAGIVGCGGYTVKVAGVDVTEQVLSAAGYTAPYNTLVELTMTPTDVKKYTFSGWSIGDSGALLVDYYGDSNKDLWYQDGHQWLIVKGDVTLAPTYEKGVDLNTALLQDVTELAPDGTPYQWSVDHARNWEMVTAEDGTHSLRTIRSDKLTLNLTIPQNKEYLLQLETQGLSSGAKVRLYQTVDGVEKELNVNPVSETGSPTYLFALSEGTYRIEVEGYATLKNFTCQEFGSFAYGKVDVTLFSHGAADTVTNVTAAYKDSFNIPEYAFNSGNYDNTPVLILFASDVFAGRVVQVTEKTISMSVDMEKLPGEVVPYSSSVIGSDKPYNTFFTKGFTDYSVKQNCPIDAQGRWCIRIDMYDLDAYPDYDGREFFANGNELTIKNGMVTFGSSGTNVVNVRGFSADLTLSSDTIYGGAKDADVSSTNLKVDAPRDFIVYGGGKNGGVTGDVNIQLMGDGTVSVTGSNGNPTATIPQNIFIRVPNYASSSTGLTPMSKAFGEDMVINGGVAQNTIEVYIGTSNQVNGHVAGGMTQSETGKINITVAEYATVKNVYGVRRGGTGAAEDAISLGDVTVTIDVATVGTVYGVYDTTMKGNVTVDALPEDNSGYNPETIASIQGVVASNVTGNVTITNSRPLTSGLYGVVNSRSSQGNGVTGNVTVKNNSEMQSLYGACDSTVRGNLRVDSAEGQAKEVYGSYLGSVSDVMLTVKSDGAGSVVGAEGTDIQGNLDVTVLLPKGTTGINYTKNTYSGDIKAADKGANIHGSVVLTIQSISGADGTSAAESPVYLYAVAGKSTANKLTVNLNYKLPNVTVQDAETGSTITETSTINLGELCNAAAIVAGGGTTAPTTSVVVYIPVTFPIYVATGNAAPVADEAHNGAYFYTKKSSSDKTGFDQYEVLDLTKPSVDEVAKEIYGNGHPLVISSSSVSYMDGTKQISLGNVNEYTVYGGAKDVAVKSTSVTVNASSDTGETAFKAVYGGGKNGDVTERIYLSVNGYLSTWNGLVVGGIYGGSENADVSGDIVLDFHPRRSDDEAKAGALPNVFLGCKNGDVTGNATLLLQSNRSNYTDVKFSLDRQMYRAGIYLCSENGTLSGNTSVETGSAGFLYEVEGGLNADYGSTGFNTGNISLLLHTYMPSKVNLPKTRTTVTFDDPNITAASINESGELEQTCQVSIEQGTYSTDTMIEQWQVYANGVPVVAVDDCLYFDKGIVGVYQEGVDELIRGFGHKYNKSSVVELYPSVKNGTVETITTTLYSNRHLRVIFSTATSGVSKQMNINLYATTFPGYRDSGATGKSSTLQYIPYEGLQPEINLTIGDGSSDELVRTGGLAYLSAGVVSLGLPVTHLTINQPFSSSDDDTMEPFYMLNQLTDAQCTINLDRARYAVTKGSAVVWDVPYCTWSCEKISSVEEPVEPPKNAISDNGKVAVGNLLIFEDAGTTYITLDGNDNGVLDELEKSAGKAVNAAVYSPLVIAGGSKVTMLSGTVGALKLCNNEYNPASDTTATSAEGQNAGTVLNLKGGEVKELKVRTGAAKSTVTQDVGATLGDLEIKKRGVSSVDVTLNGTLDSPGDYPECNIKYDDTVAGTITLGETAKIADGITCYILKNGSTGVGMTVDLSAYTPTQLRTGTNAYGEFQYYGDIALDVTYHGIASINAGVTPPRGYVFSANVMWATKSCYFLQPGEAGATVHNLDLGTVTYGYEAQKTTKIPSDWLPTDTSNAADTNGSSAWYEFDQATMTIVPKDNVAAGVHTVKLVMDSTGTSSKDVVFVTFTVEPLALNVHVNEKVTKTLNQASDTAYKRAYTLTKVDGGAAYDQANLGDDVDLLCFYGDETLGDRALNLVKSRSNNFFFTLKTAGNVEIVVPVIAPDSAFAKAEASISSLDAESKTETDWSIAGVKLTAPENYLISSSETGPFLSFITVTTSSVEPQAITYYLRDNAVGSATFGVIDLTPRTATVRVCRDMPLNGGSVTQIDEITETTANITVTPTLGSYAGEFCGLKGMYLMACKKAADGIYSETNLASKIWVPKAADSDAFTGSFTGLTASTDYDVFVIYVNEAGYAADPAALSAFSSAQPALKGSVALDVTAPVVGDTITATPNISMGDYAYGTVAYEWFADGSSLGTASEKNSYTTTAADIGKVITVKVTTSDTSGNLESAATAAVEKLAGPAAPTGGKVDNTLGTDDFSFTSVVDTVYEYRIVDGSWTELTATATTTSIPVGNVALAVGSVQVRVKETATVKAGAILSSTAAFTYCLSGSATLSGGVEYGETLRVTAPAEPAGATFHYAWTADAATVGSDSNAYTLTKSDVGKTIKVTITADGCDGSVVSNAIVATTRALSVVANPASKAYGQKDPAFTWKTPIAGQLISGDVLAGALARAEGEAVGSPAIGQGTLTAGDGYTMSFTGSTLDIRPANINLQVEVNPTSQSEGKTVSITVTAANNESDLMSSGWLQPGGVTLTGPDGSAITLKSNGDGTYTGSYTVPAAASIGDTLRFTASVNDTTGNYASVEPVTGTLTVSDKKEADMALTATESTGVVYGDSVTYTVTLAKKNPAQDVLDTLGGTVTFYLGDPDDNGTPLGTKTVGKDALSVTLDKAVLTAGSHTVYAVYSGNLDFAGSSKNITTTVAAKALTWNTTGLSAWKTANGTPDAKILGTLTVDGEVTPGDSGFVYTKLTGRYDGAAVGKHIVTVKVEGQSVNSNYTLPTGDMHIAGTIFGVNTLPNPPAGADGTIYQLNQILGLPNVPDALKQDPRLNTIELIAAAMQLRAQETLSGVKDGQFQLYDILLQCSKDQGVTWEDVTDGTFPAGGVSVLLPYPAGTTGETFDFVITHMITTGDQAGTIETIIPEETEQGLRIMLLSLSPVAVGYQPMAPVPGSPDDETNKPSTDGTNKPTTNDGSSIGLYLTMLGTSAVAMGGSVLLRKKRKED